MIANCRFYYITINLKYDFYHKSKISIHMAIYQKMDMMFSLFLIFFGTESQKVFFSSFVQESVVCVIIGTLIRTAVLLSHARIGILSAPSHKVFFHNSFSSEIYGGNHYCQ